MESDEKVVLVIGASSCIERIIVVQFVAVMVQVMKSEMVIRDGVIIPAI